MGIGSQSARMSWRFGRPILAHGILIPSVQFRRLVRPEHTTTWLFDWGIVHALRIILQLRSDIACLIVFSGDAISQRFYNSFMRYLLEITRNKFIVTHPIICEPLSLFAAVSLTLRLNIANPWHEYNNTPYSPDSGVYGIRFARDWWGQGDRGTFSMKLLPWLCGDLRFLGCNQKFYIFRWHKLWDWWSKRLIKPCESQ
jgi:hypothetical protein